MTNKAVKTETWTILLMGIFKVKYNKPLYTIPKVLAVVLRAGDILAEVHMPQGEGQG